MIFDPPEPENKIKKCCVVLEGTFSLPCFNLGLPRLMKFKLALGHLGNGNFDESADEFLDSLWATQVGQRAVEVANMIITGDYPA